MDLAAEEAARSQELAGEARRGLPGVRDRATSALGLLDRPLTSYYLILGITVLLLALGAVTAGWWYAEGRWATTPSLQKLSAQDAATIELPAPPPATPIGEGSVWISDDSNRAVLKVDPNSERITRSIHLGSRPEGIAVANGSIWVATQ